MTIDLPCTHFSPASMTDQFELSIITGTRAMSGSAASRFRKRVITAVAVEQAFVHVDVDDVRPAFDLLPGDGDRLVQIAFAHQPGELPRAGDVRPLADHGEGAVGPEHERFQAAEAACSGSGGGGSARRHVGHGLGDRADVRRRGAAAAADDVQPAVGGELAEHARHLLGRFVVAAEFVGQAGVRMAARPAPAQCCESSSTYGRISSGPSAQLMPTLNKLGVGDRDPEGLERLAGEGPAAAVGDRDRDHHRQAHAVLLEKLLDGEQAGLEVERVEDGFGQQQIDARLRPAPSTCS